MTGLDTAVLAALGDETRVGLLESLARFPGGASATTLAAPLAVSRQAVDKHLRVLQGVGLVESARRGREVRFEVRGEILRASALELGRLADAWESRLERVKRLAEAGG